MGADGLPCVADHRIAANVLCGWLGWPQQELAKRAGVGLSTIRQFESGIRKPIANKLRAMERAFEEAGVKLIENPAGIAYRGDPDTEAQKESGEAPT